MTPSPITPTVGRIVYYVVPAGPSLGQVRPATITRVWGQDCVNLHVFHDSGDGAWIDGQSRPAYEATPTSVVHHQPGDGVPPELGTWHWMPYQVGQARQQPAPAADADPRPPNPPRGQAEYA